RAGGGRLVRRAVRERAATGDLFLPERVHEPRLVAVRLSYGALLRSVRAALRAALLPRTRAAAARERPHRRGAVVLLLAQLRVLSAPAPPARADRLRRREPARRADR